MAIRVATQGATQLRLASPVLKPADFTAGRTIGGASGQIMGYWYAFMLRIPSSSGAGSWQSTSENLRRFLLGGGSTGTGVISDNGAGTSNDIAAVFLGMDNSLTSNFGGALRLRPRVMWRAGSNNAGYFPSGTFNSGVLIDTDLTALQQAAAGADAWLFVLGVSNVAAQGVTPVWRAWGANCRIAANGSVTSQLVATVPANTFWLQSTSAHLMRQVFLAGSTTIAANTPVDTTIEHLALVQGDFPWDTVNNRPHHDAIAALAGVSGVTPHSYASLVAAQNAGTLGYANLRSGKGDLTHHWTLADLTSAGLTSTGSATPVAFAPENYNSLSNGLATTASIAPTHWQGGAPTISGPPVKFHGGRGAAPFTIGGTYQAGTTALERRWETAGGAALAGLDWAAVDVFGGAGTWQTTDTLPIGGPYTLRVRDTNDTGRAVAMTGLLVGTVMLTHGQSGMAQSTSGAVSAAGTNLHGITLSANAIGLFVQGSNTDAGGASYVKPQVVAREMNPGATPGNVGSGACLLLNEWATHNPGHPLCIANMAISETVMEDWANDAAFGQWSFLGSVGEPGTGSAGGVGRVGHYAWMLGQRVDAHVLMWMPNMGGTATIRGNYRAAIDARFANSPAAPWLVLPPWRGFRDAPADGGSQRQNSVAFVGELGARGVLGPYWPDTIMDGVPTNPLTGPWTGSLHGAYNTDATVTGTQVSDQNQVGNTRISRGMGRSVAWLFDRTIKAHGPRVLAAWSDDGRATVNVELGRAVRTLNGVAISNPNVARQFWVSLDNGGTWLRSDTASPTFTVALDATATRAILTPADGGTAWAAAGANMKVDYALRWPFGPEAGARPGDAPGSADERLTERLLDALLYDDQTHRGGVNLAVQAGNPLASANAGGVTVQARGSAKLVATERWTGTRNVTVRMMAADGVTVLKERVLAVTGS